MNSDVEAILKLVAATIFADKNIYSCEIECFMQTAREIDLVKKHVPKLSEARLLSWYELNKEAIQNELHSPYFKDWFYGLLGQLKNIPEKNAILKVMHKIAYSDGQVHVSERALIVLAEKYWREDAAV